MYLCVPGTFRTHLSCRYNRIVNYDDVVGFDIRMNESVFM
jgi:hypothetical protein